METLSKPCNPVNLQKSPVEGNNVEGNDQVIILATRIIQCRKDLLNVYRKHRESLKPHIPLQCSSVIDYVTKGKIRNRGTWGMDVQIIIAFADMANLCIRVFGTMDCDAQLFAPGRIIAVRLSCNQPR